jgi:tetratricopeptide (TPR) repeat protein
LQANEDTLRRSIASSQDGRTRARLRVALAELIRVRDPKAAREELAGAAREGGATPALTMSALSLGQTLPAAERIAWLGTFAASGERAPTPAFAEALAAAQLEVKKPRDAAQTLLSLARDARVPLHHRRIAAKRAVRFCRGLEPELARALLRVAGTLSVGRMRLELLRRALTLPGQSDPEELAAAAIDWLQDGGKTRLAEEALARVHAVGHSTPMVERLTAALAARLAPRRPARRAEPRRSDGKPDGKRVARSPRPVRAPQPSFEAALAEVRAGHAGRARRIGEEAIRSAKPGPGLVDAVSALDTALREGGFAKDGLRLRRTYLEVVRDPIARREALIALAAEAAGAGLVTLAAHWQADAGVGAISAAPPAPAPATPADHYLEAQRMLARGGAEAEPVRVLAVLEKGLAGHAGADAALALAEKLSAESAGGDTAELGKRRLDLLRAAHAAEYEPGRRARLGWRLAAQLEAVGDAIGAVAVLERALAESAPGEGARVRGERARLLRTLGRTRELAGALEKDAGALLGDARLPVLAEQADLLEAAGEAERALDVRLMALAEFPGAPAVLDAARRRLEATGRNQESRSLAIAALDHTNDRERRLQLLRDAARLSESDGPDANPTEAANAWLSVLELDPGDTTAAAAAERLLAATGDWERCADLLAWQVARAGAQATPGGEVARAALLWRLAELRRAHLDQVDEALRLYRQLASGGTLLGPLADPPDLAAFVRRDIGLTTETARATVAPTPSDRSRALVDRAIALAARERTADAERDALAALDLDPRNPGALSALERLYEGETRARALAEELGRRAAKLPPSEAAPLYLGRGRAAERAGERIAAREAYRRAMALDPTLAEPVAALGALAAREGDWTEVAALLESEIKLATSAKRKGPLLLELAVVYGDRLAAPSRAVALLETAAGHLPDDPRLLDLTARFSLLAGNWQAAADALDRLAARGGQIADAAERYFSVAAAAEAAGQGDRALTLYSRSYARDPSYRPTLERLATLCFERGQWDNAWKATEALLERHGAALELEDRARLLARSAVADLHIGQRIAAVAKLKAIVTRGPSYVPDNGIRDVAESWAGMHLEPRLLVDLEARRRERVLARATEVLALTEGEPQPARRMAHEILGALALAEGRWPDAIASLEVLSADTYFSVERRSEFLVAAGDIFARNNHDPTAAEALYARARQLWPGNSDLLRPGIGMRDLG